MLASIDALCLPELDDNILASVQMQSSDEHPMQSFLNERLAMGWAVELPSPQKHKSLEACFLANLRKAGFKGGEQEATYINVGVGVCQDAAHLESGNVEENHFVTTLQSDRFNLLPAIAGLEAKVAGLGETVNHWLEAAACPLPGICTSDILYDLYLDCELGSCDDDEKAAEFMRDELGYDEDDIPQRLPSVVKHSLGGDLFIKPEKKLRGRALKQALIDAGHPQAHRLWQVATNLLPRAVNKFRKANNALEETSEWVCYHFPLVLRAIQPEAHEHDAADEWLDRCENERMQMGEPDEDFFIQQISFTQDKQGKLTAHDGLTIVAKELNAYYLLNEMLELLHLPLGDTK